MFPSPEEAIEIDVQSLAERLGEPDLRLIDCREEDEWQFCRIEGAELLPLSAFAELSAGWEPEAEQTLVVYCHHGMRSLQATQFLRAKGFANAFSLAGGIEAWSMQIDPRVPRY